MNAAWVDAGLVGPAVLLIGLRFVPRLRPYRPLLSGGGLLLLIPALFPRAGNPVGQFLFGTDGEGLRLPREAFGIAWWLLGAWLLNSLLRLLLKSTIFPDNDEPQARRLFADLASGLIYVLALVGMVGTVFGQPVSALLATSGVVAIVLGFALQSTLGDVLGGLAINIERPYGAGDWITLAGNDPGQVLQVNWRATRLRTWTHDLLIVPNSVASKAVVTNHSRPKGPHRCVLRLQVDHAVAPGAVIALLLTAASGSPGVSAGTQPSAYAKGFADSLVDYEVAFAIDSFALTYRARSAMMGRIVERFVSAGISIGAPATDVRIMCDGAKAAAKKEAVA